MKTKTIFLALMLIAISVTKGQITPSMSIPNPIPNYDGTYDNFGQNHLFYPNIGEIRYADEEHGDAHNVVKFYTMYTAQKLYLLNNNNISFNYFKPAAGTSSSDTIQRIDVEWQGSNTGAFLARVDTQNFGRLAYYDQYFASTGGRVVEGGAAIACQSIYNNIDLVYTSNNSGVVMYFIVYPGGNYNDILLHFNGSNSSSIVGNNLVAQGSWDNLTLRKPKMYQYAIAGGVVTPVTVCNPSWVNVGTDTYQINNSTSYNTSLPLIIQIQQNPAATIDTPGLCWSTYFGGWQIEFMTKTRTDASNNLYVTGMSSSGNNTFPQATGISAPSNMAYDGAVTKFNSIGQIQWSTFIGGSGNEYIRDVDFYNNSVYCVGKTSSDNTQASPFPTLNKVGAFNDNTWGGGTSPWDGFIYQFDFISNPPSFSPQWATLIGGNDWDDLSACKIDGSGNLYIVGTSSSSDMTIQTAVGSGYSQNYNTAQFNASTPPSTDGIIGKFNAAGARQWFTLFGADIITGGNGYSHAADYFYDVAIAGNNVYACGKSGGTNLPGAVNSKFVAGQFDGILVNFTTNGVLNASKFTDGNISNYAVKEYWGDVYTVGEANSFMTPVNSGLWPYTGTSPGGSNDASFSVHTGNLSASTTHNSFIGGNNEDGAYDLQFTTNNLLMIVGGTRSSNFPTTSLGLMFTAGFVSGGINDNFILAMQKGNLTPLWSSCLGSNFNESQVIPPFINSPFDLANTTISIDNQNTVRLLGTTTSFNTFPLDDGNGVPFFKPNNGIGTGNDATITCFDMADLTGIIGLKDFENTQFVFGLYPNPTSKVLSITNTAIVNNDLRYAIYDASGKKMQVGHLKAGDTKSIDVSALPQGIYIINVCNGKTTYSNKFVKAAD